MKVDIVDKYDFIDKYNEEKVSNEFIEYIIKQTMWKDRKHKIKIQINQKCEMEQDCEKILRQGLRVEYEHSLKKRNDTNLEQLLFLCIGIIAIFLSMKIQDDTIWKELLLIAGWVPLWEMLELELFADVEGRKRRTILKRLLKSEIIVNKECLVD